MKVTINDKVWDIIELDSEEFYKKRKSLLDDEHSELRDDQFIFGFCLYSFHRIYLNMNQCEDELRSTLIHELIHAWLWSNGVSYSSYGEDALCDTIAATNNFINKILSEYFKSGDKK